MFKKINLTIIIMIFLSGCSKTIIEYVPQTVVKEVYVPVKVEIPEIECEFSGTPNEVINKLLKCIADQKKILDELRKGKGNNE